MYVVGGACLGFGIFLGYLFWRRKEQQLRSDWEREKQGLLKDAQHEADAAIRKAIQAAQEDFQAKSQLAEASLAKRRAELDEMEQRLNQRDGLINKQLEGLVEQEKILIDQQLSLKDREKEVTEARAELARQIQLRKDQLSQLSHLSEAEARQFYLKEVEQEALRDAGDLTRHILEDAKIRAEDQARRIISLAIQRYSGEHSFETTTSTLSLPSEEIKGKIIGREGRNIRAFESSTGVTVLIDDTPNAVVLSSFDPVRREIARESMHRLILDGRIHPTRIEEVVGKVSQETEEAIMRAGEEAVFKVGLPPLPVEVVKLLGRLKFRHSYSQNILNHSIEVAHLAGMMASELGLDAACARRVGLLHDIGKAVNHEVEGNHAIIGAEYLRRYGESELIVNGVAAHHGEAPSESPYAILVSAADAISASRPGARSETMTTYIKRLENLERIGKSFTGVEKCFAVQAGRELRVIVQPDQINDEQAYALARSLVRRIEDELQYPGQIRVTVIRETRCVEFAK